MRSRFEFTFYTVASGEVAGGVDPTLALMGSQGWEIRGLTAMNDGGLTVALQRPLDEEIPLPDGGGPSPPASTNRFRFRHSRRRIWSGAVSAAPYRCGEPLVVVARSDRDGGALGQRSAAEDAVLEQRVVIARVDVVGFPEVHAGRVGGPPSTVVELSDATRLRC